MTELTGSLIEMNAHMVVSDTAMAMIILGFLVAVVFGIAAVVADGCIVGNAFKVVLGVIALTAFGVGLYAVKMPRVKEIKLCANGPVSIEQLATRYDIRDIDGKEITVRER